MTTRAALLESGGAGFATGSSNLTVSDAAMSDPLQAAALPAPGANHGGQAVARPWDGSVRYANLRSRLLLRQGYERHFGIPLERTSRLLEGFLRWYERHVLAVDLRAIAIDRPIFLIGMPRSGTTMLQDILCSHPRVAYITNTMHQFRSHFCAAEDLRKRLRLDFCGERYIGDSIDIRPGSANEGHLFWAEWLGIDPYALRFVDIRDADLSPDRTEQLQRIIRKVLWCFGGRGGRFFNKNANLLPYLPLLQHVFPDAKIIHLVRDPRMCAPSMLKLYRTTREQEAAVRSRVRGADDGDPQFIPYPRLPGLAALIDRYGAGDVRTTAHLWNEGIAFATRDRAAVRSFYEVRYEDILAQPEAELRRICAFCELPEVEDRDAPFWKAVGRVGKIRHVNAYRGAELVESICRDNMLRYGYL